MNSQNLKNATSIVTAIHELDELSKPALEALLAVKLIHTSNAPMGLNYVDGALPDGPFASVEFREPNAEQNQDWRLAILRVRAGVALPLEAFQGSVISKGAHPDFDPRIPPEGATIYSLDNGDRTTYLEFGAKSRLLKTVSFHRKLAPAS